MQEGNTLLGYQTLPAWQETATLFSGKCYSPAASLSLLSSLASLPQWVRSLPRTQGRRHLLEVGHSAAGGGQGGTSPQRGPSAAVHLELPTL